MMPVTNVAVFTDNDFDKVNGVTTALTAAVAHAPADLRLRVYTASQFGVDTPDYLALRSWGVGIPFYPDMQMYWPPYRRLLQALVQDRVQVIHLTTPGPIGLAALAASRRLGLPMVGSFHTDLAAYTALLSGSAALGTCIRKYMRWLYGHCEQVLVPSEATRTLVVGAGTPIDRLEVWGRGVDCEQFSPSRRSSDLRAYWRAGNDTPVLLYVGRMSVEKGVARLPEIQDRLVRLGLDHRLVLVGDGPQRSDIARRCHDALCLGTLGRDRLAEAFASSDVFVFPSTTDTAGNVVLEAQASGLPVLVSGYGGPREHMVPDVTGVVVSDDAAAWTVQVARLMTDHGLRRDMGSAGRAFATKRTWDRTLSPLYDAYRRAAGVLRDPLRRVPEERRHVA